MISIPAAYAIMLISHQESIGAFLRVPGALQVTLLVAVIYLALLVTLFVRVTSGPLLLKYVKIG